MCKMGKRGEKPVFNCKVHILDTNCKSCFQLVFLEKSYHFPISNLLKSPVQIKIDCAGIYLRCKKKLNFRETPRANGGTYGTILFLFQAVSKLEQLSKWSCVTKVAPF